MIQRLVLTVGLLASSMLGQQPIASEPADLQVRFLSGNGSNRFRTGEVIPVEVVLSSTTPNRYLEPCTLFRESNFGYPQCRFFSRWSFIITPEDGWVDYTKEFDGPRSGGGPTFEVPNRTLTSQPVAFSYLLTNRFRFDKPGEYNVRLSMQVGLNDATTQLYPRRDSSVQPNSATITTEISLEIVPAEAEWQKEIVRRGNEAYSEPRPTETNPPSKELLEYQQAKQALCTLGTPGAARVLAKALLQQDFEAQNCIERSPSVPAGVEEMHRLLVDPDVAVTSNLFSVLVGLINLDQSKKVGGLFLSQPTVDTEREALFDALPRKHGDAQFLSLATVLQYPLRSRSGGPMSGAYDLPFSPAVIAVAAADFDRLPEETQYLLLDDGWDRIRSPLMQPVVRRKAETGNGPALLRWLELEPAAATDFIRNEIVRPQPRFSSYYLRLPDASLPHEERQIATNFANLVSTNDDLVHSATLLHRYATADVLPIVLPTIDAKLTEWPCSIQVPVLAYLLKVSPKDAAPRIDKVLKSTNKTQICTGMLLTTLGVLQPSPVLERLSTAEIEDGSAAAIDGAYYLERYAPPQVKPTIWKALEKWRQRFVSSGAEKRVLKDGTGTPDDIAQSQFVGALTEAFGKAQSWVLTPEDANRLQALLNPDAVNELKCNFRCRGSLSVGTAPAEYTIYGHVTEGWQRRKNEQQSMEYLNSSERLTYGINQYHCDDLKKLKEKLLQFPHGSTFDFTGFSARDHDELEQISNFLRSHGYE